MALGVATLAFDLTPAPVRATPDLMAEYDAIAGRETQDLRLAPRAAMAIEDALSHAGWPIGRICGPETMLADNFGVSVRTLRQAFRLLEARGVCRPRRGASGGLIVLAPNLADIAAAMGNHLRWTGVSDEEVWAARDIIEPMAAASAAQARLVGDAMGPMTCQSISAVASPFLGLSLACLEQFGGGLERTPRDLKRELEMAIGEGASVRAFDLAREAVRLRRGANMPVVASATAGFHGASTGSNLAANVAARIGAEIDPQACRNGDRLGSIGTLAERHGVSSGVMIEAVRLLEDAGVARGVKGRGGGVRLQLPDAAAIISMVHGYLAVRVVVPEADLCFRLNAWAAERAGDRRSSGEMRDLDQIGRLIEAAPEPVMMKAWYALQRRLYGIADNRPLHLLAVSFAGFTVRRFAPARRPTDPAFIGGIREAGRTIVRGIDQRDGSLAWQGLDRARTLLIPGRRQLLPA